MKLFACVLAVLLPGVILADTEVCANTTAIENLESNALAALMLLGGIILSSAAGEKKCPPAGVELKPVNLNSLEDYKPLLGTWDQLKCYGKHLCNEVSCAKYTYRKADKNIHFHGSAYDERSHKPFAKTGYLNLKEPGVFEGNFENPEGNGIFYILLAKKDLYVVAGCLKNNEFSIWILGKNEKLKTHEEQELEGMLTKNKLNVELKHSLNKDCGKRRIDL